MTQAESTEAFPNFCRSKEGWANLHFCWFSSYKDSVKYKAGATSSHLSLSDNKGKRERKETPDKIRTPRSSYIGSQNFPVKKSSKFFFAKVKLKGVSVTWKQKNINWCFLKIWILKLREINHLLTSKCHLLSTYYVPNGMLLSATHKNVTCKSSQ